MVYPAIEASWNVMAQTQKPDFVFRRNGRVNLNRWGRQFSQLLAAEVCASAVVMLDTPCSEVLWRVLATHFIGQFPLNFPSRASPCAITFQLESTIADAHNSAARSRLNWRPRRFKWTCPFRRKTKSGFWACVITFQPASTDNNIPRHYTQDIMEQYIWRWSEWPICESLNFFHNTKHTVFVKEHFSMYSSTHSNGKCRSNVFKYCEKRKSSVMS